VEAVMVVKATHAQSRLSSLPLHHLMRHHSAQWMTIFRFDNFRIPGKHFLLKNMKTPITNWGFLLCD
jgi:hypothetical protein